MKVFPMKEVWFLLLLWCRFGIIFGSLKFAFTVPCVFVDSCSFEVRLVINLGWGSCKHFAYCFLLYSVIITIFFSVEIRKLLFFYLIVSIF